MREVFRMVESDTIYVVPVFISEGYFTQTVIPRELELEGRHTRREGRTIHYCDPVGSHPRMTEALLRRAREVAPNVPLGATSLFIVGHGTDLNDNSARAAKEQAARIQALGEYAQVVSSYMEEPPLIAHWDKLSNQAHVVIVPFFIADGLHSYQDIPVLIGIETRARSGGERNRDLPAQSLRTTRQETLLRERDWDGTNDCRGHPRSSGSVRASSRLSRLELRVQF